MRLHNTLIAGVAFSLYNAGMKIYLATNNADKKREFSELLPRHDIITPQDEGIKFEPVETGATFYENSIIKAEVLHRVVKSPVVADDSGLCVDALGGRPGIYSSRYAGPNAPRGLANGKKISQREQDIFLLKELDDALAKGCDVSHFPNGARSAHYTCAMVLYLGRDRFYIAEETMEGALVDSIGEARGTGGFGYDPIFLLPKIGKTVAELSDEEKNAISHRGKAARQIKRIIEELER